MPTTASIELLSEKASLPRSSHSLALISNILYIIGGEVKSREPASPFLHTFNLEGSLFWKSILILIDATLEELEVETSPTLRVGAASVVAEGKIYLWGGRGGKSMSAIDEGGKFWVFDPASSLWSQTSLPKGDIPEPRSYHSLAAIDVLSLNLYNWLLG
jgi:Galactose oxidase, central domain